MILLTVPIFAPLVEGLGFDLIWFGFTFVAHFVLILAIVVTVATFKVSENVYRFKTGYHSPDRQRGHVYYRDVHGNAYRVPLPKNDPGGEHD